MNGLFVDNNIGEMFNDIFNDAVSDKLGNIFGEGTEFGLGELTINVPTGDRLWYNFLPVMVIVAVIILGLVISKISKKNRKKNEQSEISSDVEKIFAEAEENFEEFTLNKPTEAPEYQPQPEALKPAEDKAHEGEPIKVDKIEVITTKPALKFGKDNINTTRSGRVFTEEELEALIRK